MAQRRATPRAEEQGRSGEVDAAPVDPEERTTYSPFDLEPDEVSTRPARETWRESLVRGRATRTPLAVHNVVFLVVLGVVAVVLTGVLLAYFLA